MNRHKGASVADRFVRSLFVVAWLVSMIGSAFGADPVLSSPELEYVQAMRSKGLAPLVVEYLRDRRKNLASDSPIRADIEFEWAAALAASSEAASDLTDRQRLLDQARAAFESFRQSFPEHPRSVDASVQEASIELGRGRVRVMQAQLPGNESSALDLAKQARDFFRRAHETYIVADQRITGELSTLTGFLDPQKDRPIYRRRETLFQEQVEARFQSGLALFLMADSYATIDDRVGDPRKRKEFKTALRQSMGIFDKLAEEHRREVAGLYGSLWSARCLIALDEHTKADAILDSLLAHENRELEAFQREVFHFRLLSLAAQGDDGQVVRLAEPWMKENTARRKESSYQGVQWATAKSLIRLGENAEAAGEKERLFREADDLLNLVSRARGPLASQASREQLLLSRRRNRLLKGNSFVSLSAEGMARLDEIPSDASEEEKTRLRRDAVAKLEEALSKVDARDRPEDISEAKCRLAYTYFESARFDKTISIVEPLVQAEPEVPRSAEAALLAISAYARLIEQARSVPAGNSSSDLVSRLQSLVSVMTKRWPQSNTSDQARLLLAKIAFMEERWKDVPVLSDQITTDPLLQAKGESLSGSARWREAMALEASSPDRQALLTEALSRLSRASSLWPKEPTGPISAEHFRHEVVRADAALYSGQPKEAAESVLLLAPALESSQVDSLDPALHSSGVAIVMRTWLAQGDVDRAQKFFQKMAPSLAGTGNEGVTRSLLSLVRSIRASETSSTGATGPSSSSRKGLEALLDQVNDRQEGLEPKDRLYLADAYLSIGNGPKATALIEPILSSLPPADQVVGRLLLAKAESAAGKHPQAIASITALLKENVGVKEVILARGEILESAKDFSAAIKHWQWYLDRLKRVQPRPVELYEVTDRICRLALALPRTNPEAKKLLGSALRLPAYLLETDTNMPADWRSKLTKRVQELQSQ
ncbi:hypothetical protein K2X85_19410 [bacterium]|nr:hypothetical protein [bacterium]